MPIKDYIKQFIGTREISRCMRCVFVGVWDENEEMNGRLVLG